jgi:hypothetical protein
MTTYTAYFRTDAGSASHEFEADTPEQALALARQFYDDDWSQLYFEPYDRGIPVNEITISDAEGEECTAWLDDELRLSLAAPDLLEALEAVCALPPDDAGERTIPAGFLDQARAAITKAKGDRPEPSGGRE